MDLAKEQLVFYDTGTRVLARIREIGCAFPKVGSARVLTMNSATPSSRRRRRCWGRVWEDVKPPLIGGGPGGLPRKIFEI